MLCVTGSRNAGRFGQLAVTAVPFTVYLTTCAVRKSRSLGVQDNCIVGVCNLIIFKEILCLNVQYTNVYFSLLRVL